MAYNHASAVAILALLLDLAARTCVMAFVCIERDPNGAFCFAEKHKPTGEPPKLVSLKCTNLYLGHLLTRYVSGEPQTIQKSIHR